MFLNHSLPPLILYYCIKSGPNVKEGAKEPRRKSIQSPPSQNNLLDKSLTSWFNIPHKGMFGGAYVSLIYKN